MSMWVYHVCAFSIEDRRSPVGFLGTGSTDRDEQQCECWELNVGPVSH